MCGCNGIDLKTNTPRDIDDRCSIKHLPLSIIENPRDAVSAARSEVGASDLCNRVDLTGGQIYRSFAPTGIPRHLDSSD